MILQKENINSLTNLYDFKEAEHRILSILLLERLAQSLDFKLKIQKSSIQLLNAKAFAVIGFRRNHKHIFIEFYSKAGINSNRIISTVKDKNEYIINRINILEDNDIDAELIEFITCSNKLTS